MLDKSNFRDEILSRNVAEVCSSFQNNFSTEIEVFIDEVFYTYKSLKSFELCVGLDKRRQYVALFIFNALRSIITSFSINISGYVVPSGNLMRHFIESISMAILISNKELNTFEIYDKDPRKVSVQKSLGMVKKNAEKLGIDKKSWDTVIEVNKFFDKYSHASALAVSGSAQKCRSLGAIYDDSSTGFKEYKKIISLQISSIRALRNAIEGIKTHLLRDTQRPPVH